MKNKKSALIVISLIIVLILLDQISKIFIIINPENIIIKGILRFKITENTGGAFGIGEGSTITYIITNIVVLGIIIKFMVNGNKLIDKKTKILLSLILAGGISNLIDRITRGYVIDFIDITELIKFPILNLADIYITIGWVGIVVIFTIFTFKEKKGKKQITNKE